MYTYFYLSVIVRTQLSLTEEFDARLNNLDDPYTVAKAEQVCDLVSVISLKQIRMKWSD